MKISNNPPKFQWIIKLFLPGYDFNKVIAFAFGDTIYAKNKLEDYNLIHEKTHLRQMKYSKLYGIIHFLRFIFSKEFRYKTELEAYKKEYEYIKKIAPKSAPKTAEVFAKTLAGEGPFAYVYGKTQDYDIALKEIMGV